MPTILPVMLSDEEESFLKTEAEKRGVKPNQIIKDALHYYKDKLTADKESTETASDSKMQGIATRSTGTDIPSGESEAEQFEKTLEKLREGSKGTGFRLPGKHTRQR